MQKLSLASAILTISEVPCHYCHFQFGGVRIYAESIRSLSKEDLYGHTNEAHPQLRWTWERKQSSFIKFLNTCNRIVDISEYAYKEMFDKLANTHGVTHPSFIQPPFSLVRMSETAIETNIHYPSSC